MVSLLFLEYKEFLGMKAKTKQLDSRLGCPGRWSLEEGLSSFSKRRDKVSEEKRDCGYIDDPCTHLHV